MKVTFAFLLLVVVAIASTDAKPESLWDRVRSGTRDTVRSVSNGARNSANFVKDAALGTADMGRAYMDMREANFKNSDKFFHARGNFDAAQRGPGGAWAASVISNTRETVDQLRGGTPAQSARDQEANHWGRSGGNPDRYRPVGLPAKYGGGTLGGRKYFMVFSKKME